MKLDYRRWTEQSSSLPLGESPFLIQCGDGGADRLAYRETSLTGLAMQTCE